MPLVIPKILRKLFNVGEPAPQPEDFKILGPRFFCSICGQLMRPKPCPICPIIPNSECPVCHGDGATFECPEHKTAEAS